MPMLATIHQESDEEEREMNLDISGDVGSIGPQKRNMCSDIQIGKILLCIIETGDSGERGNLTWLRGCLSRELERQALMTDSCLENKLLMTEKSS